MTIKNRTRFTLRIPEKLFITLKRSAEDQGVSINSFMLKILWHYYAATNEQQAEQEGSANAE
jgi:predicted HicB family RNase H-like nuclease